MQIAEPELDACESEIVRQHADEAVQHAIEVDVLRELAADRVDPLEGDRLIRDPAVGFAQLAVGRVDRALLILELAQHRRKREAGAHRAEQAGERAAPDRARADLERRPARGEFERNFGRTVTPCARKRDHCAVEDVEESGAVAMTGVEGETLDENAVGAVPQIGLDHREQARSHPTRAGGVHVARTREHAADAAKDAERTGLELGFAERSQRVGVTDLLGESLDDPDEALPGDVSRRRRQRLDVDAEFGRDPIDRDPAALRAVEHEAQHESRYAAQILDHRLPLTRSLGRFHADRA